MKIKRLGRTELSVAENGFGALPIQRISRDDAAALLRRAYDSGINFYDTARFYTDSEEKIGYALGDVRKDILIATKSMGRDKRTALEHLETSLRNLKTDYVDIFQLHNIPTLPDVNNEESDHYALLEAKKSGKCRFIGITTHRLDVAVAAAKSGLYDTIQFPLSYLSTPDELALIDLCREQDLGVIAMKAMSGGLISSPEAAFAFLRGYDNLIPIWGVQKMRELEDFLAYAERETPLDERLLAAMERDRAELQGNFCRGCGYCQGGCPAGIEISNAARMILMLRRAPWQEYTTPAWREKMKKINDCIGCGACRRRCPYGLDCPTLLRENYADYEQFCREHGLEF